MEKIFKIFFALTLALITIISRSKSSVEPSFSPELVMWWYRSIPEFKILDFRLLMPATLQVCIFMQDQRNCL